MLWMASQLLSVVFVFYTITSVPLSVIRLTAASPLSPFIWSVLSLYASGVVELGFDRLKSCMTTGN